MKMRIKFQIRKLLSCNVTRPNNPNQSTDLDVREEYANAFRTESYNEFWLRVLALSIGDSATCKNVGSSTAARLPSYRLFVEHLLEPAQPTITRILDLTQNRPKSHSILSEYFSKTADAFVLCGLLLKDIDNTRVKYRFFKTTIESLESVEVNLPRILTRLTQFFHSVNPFVSSSPTPHRFQAVQAGCFGLLKRLESSRDKARAKLGLINNVQCGSAICLVALTTSLTVIVAAHALAILVAAPCLVVASFELASTKRLARLSAQLDAAAKGTYILSRDLDTISRLMARLNDEMEHMRTIVKFWLERGEDRLQASGEIVRQLRADSSFSQQLDELEEHLYLCFMTINRARNLVIKEILDSGRPVQDPNMWSK
ncbi:hypothetical protein F0562_031210 [Nyssa sinensis]|uniref:Uncharacterized protein n=1 Tax=Nyssa sinensis TaxID=561372 RepID=A0A5J5ARS0_9ASTE|nr:hypothetical protein F0562_031210 [Nyssa sinensis]